MILNSARIYFFSARGTLFTAWDEKKNLMIARQLFCKQDFSFWVARFTDWSCDYRFSLWLCKTKHLFPHLKTFLEVLKTANRWIVISIFWILLHSRVASSLKKKVRASVKSSIKNKNKKSPARIFLFQFHSWEPLN